MWGKRGRRPAWRLLGATIAVAAATLPAASPVGGSTLCPCSLFSGFPAPELTGQTDPHPVELGLKFAVDERVELTKIRFYKDAAETGSHTGRIWKSDGTELAQVPFGSETASGWQETDLASPLVLEPGTTYVVSVGFNEAFVITQNALGSAVSSGPLRSIADGANGTYNVTQGSLPLDSYQNSNYFIDVVVDELDPPTATLSPADASTGVAVAAAPSAVFSREMDAATIGDSSFTLEGPGGPVAASVAYDAVTKTATLTPSAQLAHATTYTARLDAAVSAADGTALGSAVSWAFTTVAASVPTVTPPPVSPPAPAPPAPPPAPPTQADLSVALEASPAAPTVGSELSYTATVANAGPASATNVVLTATLGSSLAFRSAASAVGGCTETGSVRCVLGTIPSGASVRITLSAAARASGEVTSVVAVGADQPDPNAANNRAGSSLAVATRILPVADARLQVAMVRKRVVAGTRLVRTWLSVTPSGLPFQPARLQLALDPQTPWSWRGFVERFSFRSAQPWIWIRLADGSGTETSWQRIALPRSP